MGAPESGICVSDMLVCVMYAPTKVESYVYVVTLPLGSVLLAFIPVSK